MGSRSCTRSWYRQQRDLISRFFCTKCWLYDCDDSMVQYILLFDHSSSKPYHKAVCPHLCEGLVCHQPVGGRIDFLKLDATRPKPKRFNILRARVGIVLRKWFVLNLYFTLYIHLWALNTLVSRRIVTELPPGLELYLQFSFIVFILRFLHQHKDGVEWKL